ncbi:MAG: hypothetical protein FWC23_11020 [Chitinispirillia bacterium]|nr:hypothetical protein [Chitinispirillia bacterium]MCL2269699.1 hypothetical protein [Chitinispirillia bacterium]
MAAAVAEEDELIDGLTFDEWLDMIPVGVERMTEAEKGEALRDVKARAAAIREERAAAGVNWRAKVYGKADGAEAKLTPYHVPVNEQLMVGEPPAPYYGADDYDPDEFLEKAEEYRLAGGRFLTVEEFFANMDAAIKLGASLARS